MKSEFLCFDTEDDSKELLTAGKSGFLKRCTQIAALTDDGQEFYNTGQVDQFLEWIQGQPAKYIYAHNLQYDLGNLFGHHIDCLDCVLVGGRLIRAGWKGKVFLDSFNIWPMGAAKLGAAFGLEKLKTENMASDKSYVFRDVEIISAAMKFAWGFCRDIGLERCPATLGGLCIQVWQHWGGENVHDSTLDSRLALYGGRVELFKQRNETPDVCYTDINSLYPYVMQKEFPAQLENYGQTMTPHGIATVSVRVPKTALAVLPWRNDDGRILYPFGRFSGTWTMPELAAATTRGAKIEKVLQVWGTQDTIRPYGIFVQRLYKNRLASGNEAERLFFKLLMNNLYGRLGTTGLIGRSVKQTDKNRNTGVPYGKKVMVEYKMPLGSEVNWCHAAYVTAYGRLELLKHLEIIGAERMIYCDTDSAIFDCPGREIPFPIGNQLGAMKLESWESACETYAPKMYRIGAGWKAKGVPKRLQEEYITTGRAEFDLPFKFRESITFFDRNNSKRLSVWRKIVKINRQEYERKKIVGNRYFPCEIKISRIK